MMMAQPFPAHQAGMAHHPGLPPGHPMAAGQHPNAAQLAGQAPGAGMVQQLPPGVSAPGGPQASQAGPMMGGMPPVVGTTGPGGPGPSAHALSHLGPAPNHQMFQQQQMAQNFQNPQLLQQHQQNQMMRHRLMLQQQQAAAQQQGQQPQPAPPPHSQHGVPTTLPNGTAGLSAAQIAAMQANPNMRAVPMHIQQQMQAHGPQGQPQTMPQPPQQMFAVPYGAQPTGNPPQPGQQTPQQRASSQPQAMQDGPSATPHPQPSPATQGRSTPSQPQPTSQPLPPSSQPPQPQVPRTQPPPHSQPQPQPTTQGSQGPSPQNQGFQQPPQPPQQMTAQEAQLRAQQQGNAQAMMMPRGMMNPVKRSPLTRLYSFAEYLSGYGQNETPSGLQYWTSFVEQFYSSAGVLRQGVWSAQGGAKQFEISTPLLPRYYHTVFESGVKQVQMIVEDVHERDTPNGGQILESSKAYFFHWFVNGVQLVSHATLRAQYDANGKIEILDITPTGHKEYIPRNLIQPPASPDQKQSPSIGKAMNKKALKQQQQALPQVTVPESMVTEHGVSIAVMSFLEVAETISSMQTLFLYSLQNPHLSPPDALRQLVSTYPTQAQAAAAFNQPYAVPHPGAGQRTPSLGDPSQFASPAQMHLGLPGAQGSPHLGGSTHTPSPAKNITGGVPMVPQQSQPGTNTSGSQGTSANTSPNVNNNNKRRRASTIKAEAEEGNQANEVNGNPPTAKVKASPRVGGKRQKGTS